MSTVCLSPDQAFRVMIRFLSEVRTFMPNQAAIDGLVSELCESAVSRGAWHSAVSQAFEVPELVRHGAGHSKVEGGPGTAAEPACLTRLQSFDAMVRMLEAMTPRHPVAPDILSELYYSEAYSESLNTRDPGTWNDWLRHVEAELASASNT
jgi:hypothetical protein